MSWTSNLVVVFECNNDSLIRQHAACTIAENREAYWFLDEMSQYHKDGSRFLVTWGKVCNHLDIEAFIKGVLPFFEALYKHRDGISEYNNVMIFHEVEQRESTNAYQISSKIVLKEFKDLPFTWGVW